MAVLKCKFCGGNVSSFPDIPLGKCSACGSTATLPRNPSESRIAAHNCGNYLRRSGKFDKGLSIYQEILRQDPTDAEACWGSALCRFGIQYRQEMESGTFTPVCLRPEAGSFPKSGEYLAALANSSGAVQLQYEKEAARIARGSAGPAPECESKQTSQADVSPLLKKAYWLLEQERWEEADRCCSEILCAVPTHSMAALGKLLAEFRCQNPKALAQVSVPIDESPNFRTATDCAEPELKQFLEKCAHRIRRTTQMAQIQEYYSGAVAAMNRAATEADYRTAAGRFAKLGSYQDAERLSRECLRRADMLRKDAIYQSAVRMKERARTLTELKEVADTFARIPGWKDANVQLVECRQKIDAVYAAHSRPEKRHPRLRAFARFLLAAVGIFLAGFLLVTQYLIPELHYRDAEELLAANRKEEAIAAFQALGSFRDAADRALGIQQSWYLEAETLEASGDTCRAAAAFGGLRDYEDSRERSRSLWQSIVRPQLISAGGWFTVGLRSDSTVESIGDNREKQCSTGSWLNIVSLSAGWEHTVGLRSDGTVVTAGYGGDGRGDTGLWQDMVSVDAGQWHTVGLRSNGRVYAIGCPNQGRLELDDWRDIIAVSAGRHHTLGLRADGTVLSAGNNSEHQCDVSGWSGILEISAGGNHSLGLKKDGTVVAVGDNSDGQCLVSDWNGIVSVAAGYYHSVALRADGTVVATGYNKYGQCDVSRWTDIVAISAGGFHTVGLKSDGTVVATGRNTHDQCNTEEWAQMMLP